MENQETCAKTMVTGYCNATRSNGDDYFRSEDVHIWRSGEWLMIEGINRSGQNWVFFNLGIDPSTPPGDRPFEHQKELGQVYFLDGNNITYAQSGTFNAQLNHSTKNYRITFTLLFSIGVINGYIDVSE